MQSPQRIWTRQLLEVLCTVASLMLYGAVWANAAAIVVRGTKASTEDVMWGCEDPPLQLGDAHVVVATYDGDATQWLPWIWQLGLTNTEIFIYHRLEDGPATSELVRTLTGLQLPCGMKLTLRQLLPNRGRDSAVFLYHILNNWEDLPRALYFVHDHGPAARHSMCGPFYRRVRAFYRGIVVEKTGGTVSRRSAVFRRFSSRMRTLSSGCVESWARGCCAMFLCTNNPTLCPWEGAGCSEPGNLMRYMNMQYNYDPRHENQVVGVGDELATTALLRYASTKTAGGTGMWNITFEYGAEAAAAASRGAAGGDPAVIASKAKLISLLREHGVTRLNFKSETHEWLSSELHHIKLFYGPSPQLLTCCASLIVRREHIKEWPAQLYRDLLEYTTDIKWGYEASKAVAQAAWDIWAGGNSTKANLNEYMDIDLRLPRVRGCPGTVPKVKEALAKMGFA